MASYDSRRFSTLFSERTVKNYKHILKVVRRDELEKQAQERFLEKYVQLIDEIGLIKEELRTDAIQVDIVSKKNKNEMRRKIHSIASKLERAKDDLSNEMASLISPTNIEGDKLFEVTQLLNSLMGIAVLPYEMHKEYFQNVKDDWCMEESDGNSLRENQEEVKNCEVYTELKKIILDYYAKGKWYSSYSRDLTVDNKINEEKVVFGFLRHIRNVTCHSGSNAISIIPLDEGKVIEYIAFYDRSISNIDDSIVQEFAMRLSIEELEKIVLAISEFYSGSPIAFIDKTEKIKNVEERVNELLRLGKKS